MNNNRRPIAQRFWEKVDRSGTCWIWIANTNNAGYGLIWDADQDKKVYAHRWSYEAVNGPIPDGLSIDHLCRNPLCVNPAHLEAVTHKENILRSDAPPALNARKSMCPSGHPYDESNTYTKPNGSRECRACCKARAAATERRRSRILKAAAVSLGMSVPAYTNLHGKSMRKALSITAGINNAEAQAEAEAGVTV